MEPYYFTETVEIEITECAHCGIQFGAPKYWMNAARKDKRDIYCPNGHTLSFKDPQWERDLKRAKENERWWRDEAERTGRQLSATRGVVTRIKNRIANGICPCCHRQFANLQRHMAGHHPTFRKEESEA
jgi:hypothetical protein